MASTVLKNSLQRTDSTGQLNVFIVLKKKINNELLIVSREDLPPTLRNGRLILNQKIIIRDEQRNSIEGVIVYMSMYRKELFSLDIEYSCTFLQTIDPDRDSCIAARKEMMNNKIEQNKKTSGSSGSSVSKIPLSASQTVIRPTPAKNIAKKPLAGPSVQKKPIHTSPIENKQSIEPDGTSAGPIESRQCDDSSDETRNGSREFSFSPNTDANEKQKSHSTCSNAFDVSIRFDEDNENEFFINKINQLNAQTHQLKLLVQQRDSEIKRLRSTTISMLSSLSSLAFMYFCLALPTEQVTRDFICHMSDKIKQSTTEYKYLGNLSKDAQRLGIHVTKLTEFLTSKTSISSIARNIFKEIVSVDKRNVSCWNELPDDVVCKEKMLIRTYNENSPHICLIN